MKRLLWILSLSFLFAGCSTLMPKKKLDSAHVYTTETGFQFQFPMGGEWFEEAGVPGMYVVSKKPTEEGNTQLAIVRHGTITTPGGKVLSSRQMLEGFQRDIEKESQSGRVIKAKNKFSQRKYQGTDCLYFEQLGEDQSPKGPLNISNEGVICLHPQRPYHFAWLAISERGTTLRSPQGALNVDKQKFFNSLQFVK